MIAVTLLWHRERRGNTARRLTENLQARLVPLQNGIDGVLRDEAVLLTKLLSTLTTNAPVVEQCSAIQADPEVESLIVWNRRTNRILFPDRIDHLSDERQAAIRQGMKVLREESQSRSADEPKAATKGSFDKAEIDWVTWYQDRRTWIALVHPIDGEHWAMVIPPPTRWIGKVIASNEANFRLIAADSLIQLRDGQAKVIHQGGKMDLQSENALANVSLNRPLESWNLVWFGNVSYRKRIVGDDPFWLAVLALVSLASLLIVGASIATVSLGRQLRLAEQRVSFVNQVSHELRTPLTNIGMYTDLLEKGLEETANEEDSASLQKVHVIREESQRLNRLIRNVLEFGRTRKRILRPEPAVLDEIIRQSIALFAPRFREIGLEVVMMLNAERPAELDADVVEQIMVNFLGNAEKYAGNGKKLWVQSEQTKDRVTFRVLDSGPGIPASEQSRIFRPFYRLDDSISAPTGSGIGLTVAQELASLHGGRCFVESSSTMPETLTSIRQSGVKFGACFRCDLVARLVNTHDGREGES